MDSQRQPGRRDPLQGERVEFPSRRGTLLVGDVHRPAEPNGVALVLCHGMESTRVGTKQTAMVDRFVPQGYTVLRFDFSYVGESEGRFEDLTISGEVDDTIGALDFLADFAPTASAIVGSSLGGAVALLAAAQAPSRVDAIVALAAVADTALFTEGLTSEDIADWRATGRRAWRDGYIKSTFLDDVQSLDILSEVATLRQPILALHGVQDPVVPLAHAHSIAAAAAGPVQLETFEGVGHRFEEPGALDDMLARMDGWLNGLHLGQRSA